jgi:DNA-binding beta-propeller fold protein YncE
LAVEQSVATGPRPAQVAVNALTHKVYVSTQGNLPLAPGAVEVIDANTQSLIKTIDLSMADPAAEPYGVTVNPITNRVYAALDSGKLVIIDGQSDTVLRAVSPPVATGLEVVAVNPATNNVFASSTTGDLIFVYDADMSRWSDTLTVGPGRLRGIGINPLTYQVMVSNPSANSVSLIRDYGAYQPFKMYMPVTFIP